MSAEDFGQLGDKLDEAEFKALALRLQRGAEATLASMPPFVPELVHLRDGPRAACTVVTRATPDVTFFDDDYTRELSSDPEAVTCPKCRGSEAMAVKTTLWQRFKAWVRRVFA